MAFWDWTVARICGALGIGASSIVSSVAGAAKLGMETLKLAGFAARDSGVVDELRIVRRGRRSGRCRLRAMPVFVDRRHIEIERVAEEAAVWRIGVRVFRERSKERVQAD